ncbi:hypothetical protein TWF730_004319 [Orbilia blumenaviensis]|uniref:Uncharacterized protein n=1 Tax=Orbilia blumenaviensis TaxID=1796055 RepID=A0AAV9TZK3_9PEZI
MGHLRCIPQRVLKTIFMKHDLDTRVLHTSITNSALGAKDAHIGSRCLKDEASVPKSYDIFFMLPQMAITFDTSWRLVFEGNRELLYRQPINSWMIVFPYGEENPGEEQFMSDTSDLLMVFKFPSTLQQACANFKPERETGQRDPFFTIILLLKSWIQLWKGCADKVQWTTRWLDMKVQKFIQSESNEAIYNDLNTKLHLTQRHVSDMSFKIVKSKHVFKYIQDQHAQFLEFTGLKSETSEAVREEMTRLILDIEHLSLFFEQELDKAKSSSAWLSTAISVKHTQAMRSSGETMQVIAVETKKIAQDNKKESETMRVIATITQKDGQSMKVIAFLTMIYLPGAFVSSIFGWSIISFDVADDGTQRLIVSSQWRLYVVVTVVLTVITMLGCLVWIWMSRKKQAVDEKAEAEKLRLAQA